MSIESFLIENTLVLVPVLYILGVFLKRTPAVKDWYIPWILLAAGIAGAIGLMKLGIDAIIQGVLVTGATVLGNQLVKQTMHRD